MVGSAGGQVGGRGLAIVGSGDKKGEGLVTGGGSGNRWVG